MRLRCYRRSAGRTIAFASEVSGAEQLDDAPIPDSFADDRLVAPIIDGALKAIERKGYGQRTIAELPELVGQNTEMLRAELERVLGIAAVWSGTDLYEPGDEPIGFASNGDIVQALRLTPEKAIEFLKGKGVLTTETYLQLEAALHERSFTVAGVASMQILEEIKGELVRSLEKGRSLADFVKSLGDRLQEAGWAGNRPSRLENIFRTNTAVAYAYSRDQLALEAEHTHPYARYVAVLDSRTRPDHAALHGLVFPTNDPFWKAFNPPWGYQCRCDKVYLSEARVRRKGYQVSSSEGAIGEEETTIGDRTVKIPTLEVGRLAPKSGIGKIAVPPAWARADGIRLNVAAIVADADPELAAGFADYRKLEDENSG